MKIPRNSRAFSLVEVVLSLGLITFCLTVLMGLIPVGLGAIQNSTQQSGAANCMQEIDDSIRGATTNATGEYQALGLYTNFVWTIGGSTNNYSTSAGTIQNLSLSGSPTTVTSDQRLAAAVQIDSPASSTNNGTAFVTVAWPKTAQWNTTTMTWSKAQGSVSTWVIFTPTP